MAEGDGMKDINRADKENSTKKQCSQSAWRGEGHWTTAQRSGRTTDWSRV